METAYHIEITRLALENVFSEKALKTIISANIKQDRICYLLGHDHIHFDGSAFESGFQYIADQEQLIKLHLKTEDYESARKAFGRITHSWQDYFGHTNYVRLWTAAHHHQPAEEIVIDDPQILTHPGLSSGKNYGLIEIFSLLPGLRRMVIPLMPHDSHACMNLDSPAAGEGFKYAFWAAVKATKAAYERIAQKLQNDEGSIDMIQRFKGQ